MANLNGAPNRRCFRFDWLVTGGILARNPATSVRRPQARHQARQAPVFTTDQARVLIESLDTSTSVGLGRSLSL